MRNFVGILLVGLSLSACGGPEPFPTERAPLPHPRVPDSFWKNRVEILRGRGQELKTLAGVVQVAIDSPHMSGSIDIVVVHEQPDRTHFQMVKGLRLEAHPLYDLTLAGERYRLDTYDDSGSASTTVGALENFSRDHQELAPLVWMRDLMFVPDQHVRSGREGECPQAQTYGATRTASLRYELDCNTLAVLGVRANIRESKSSSTRFRINFELWYDDYRPVAPDLYLPFHIIARDDDGWFRMEAVVVDAEVNGVLPSGVFDIPEPKARHD